MAFDDLTGASGFTPTSDGAEANLNINMSEDSARNLWDVQAAVQQIATDFQTAVRAAADFNSYLISIRETGQTIKMPLLGMEGGEGGNMSYAGGRVDSGSIPIGAQGGEMGMASRVAEMEENSSGMGGGAMGSRAPNAQPPDVAGFVGQLTNAAFMTGFLRQDESRARGTQTEEEAAANEYNGQHRAEETASGGGSTPSGRGGGRAGRLALNSALGYLRGGVNAGRSFLSGGGAGALFGAVSKAGAIGAIGYAGYELVNAGLETYAQSRAMGIATNNSAHGTGWGFQQRIGQAEMAMSPYVTAQDAADIYNAAIDQGWASRPSGFAQGDFGSAVNFMYGAAKDYNMTPAASAQLLQTNALGAGESVAALSEQLLTLKKSLDGTGVSTAAANSVFQSYTQFLIGQGASPGDAARIVGGGLVSQAGNTLLGPNGLGMQIDQAAMQSTGIQSIVAGINGHMPGSSFGGAHADKDIATYQGLVHNLALQYTHSGLDPQDQAAQFAIAWQHLTGTPISTQDALSKMQEAAADPNWYTNGQKVFLAKSTMPEKELQRNITVGGRGSMFSTAYSNDPRNEGNLGLLGSFRYYTDQVNTLLQNSGDDLSKVVLYGPDGKPVMENGNRVAGVNIARWMNDQSNYAKFTTNGSGYYIVDKTGQHMNAHNLGNGGANPSSAAGNGANANNTVYITLSDEAKKYFATSKDSITLPTGQGN